MKTMIRTILIICSLFLADTAIEGLFNYSVISTGEAEAVVGRPATPGSVAGVARRSSRRTTRRVIRRSTIYAPVLPMGCTVVVIEGASLHSCGGTYYQPYQGQYVVVYVE